MSTNDPANQPMDSRPDSSLIAALAEVAKSHPFERKLVVCHSYGQGRELLRRLAVLGGGWIGFESTTPAKLALELTADLLAADGLKVADAFDELALLDDAIDGTLDDAPARLRELAEGAGLRQAIAESIRALRLAGVAPDTLRKARLRDREKRDALARILSAYESALWRAKLADIATVFRRATGLIEERGLSDDTRVLLLPGHGRRGVSGAFLESLMTRGAVILRDDAVVGLPYPQSWFRESRSVAEAPGATPLSYLHAVDRAPRTDHDPAIEQFAAASLTDELREVLRRVMASGLRWDEVDIIATEPSSYGAALDSLARRLDIPVTYAAGLPFERTRPGRALRGYLRWIREGFPEDVIRGMLMSGDLALPDADAPPGSSLARRLRRLKIGRGRERYRDSIERARRLLSLPPSLDDERSPEEIAQSRERERRELDGLAAVLDAILDATPTVPDRIEPRALTVRPADLARGALALMRFVPAEVGADGAAKTRLTERLERLEQKGRRPTSLDAAVAILLAKIETRVPASDPEGAAPWSSAGGHLHMSDLTNGGLAGRRATFIVGLDAFRFPGAGVQHALLGDDDRNALRSGVGLSLPTTAERIEQERYELAALFARLRGHLTLSYAAWDPAEARTVAPAAEMLQAFRLVKRDPGADYENLHASLTTLASAVPGSARLDAADVWLGALAHGGVFRLGEDVVREAFRPLDRGLSAQSARQARELTAYHGRIVPRASLDPRSNPDIVVSASRLESLGACPRRYMLRYVLRVRPPDDPEMVPERWLSPLNRGSLLHSVYERSLRLARETGVAFEEAGFDALVAQVLEDEIAEWHTLLPPPGTAVFGLEVDALKRDAKAFVMMVRKSGAEWVALEHKFGRNGEPAVELKLRSDASIRVAGAIDRVDRRPEGLVVIDYKTGSKYDYERRSGTYRGGRRLQHVLYRAIAEQIFGEPAIRAEYHFPTFRAGDDNVASYTREQLAGGLVVVERLLDLAKTGLFFPTDEPNDCKFCDFQSVCRVDAPALGALVSPPADWTQSAGDLEELRVFRELRES